jgi:hypothetical protein
VDKEYLLAMDNTDETRARTGSSVQGKSPTVIEAGLSSISNAPGDYKFPKWMRSPLSDHDARPVLQGGERNFLSQEILAKKRLYGIGFGGFAARSKSTPLLSWIRELSSHFSFGSVIDSVIL